CDVCMETLPIVLASASALDPEAVMARVREVLGRSSPTGRDKIVSEIEARFSARRITYLSGSKRCVVCQFLRNRLVARPMDEPLYGAGPDLCSECIQKAASLVAELGRVEGAARRLGCAHYTCCDRCYESDGGEAKLASPDI